MRGLGLLFFEHDFYTPQRESHMLYSDYAYLKTSIKLQKTRYRAEITWVLICKRIGLPNEIIEMVKNLIHKQRIECWIDAHVRELLREKQKAEDARKLIMSHQLILHVKLEKKTQQRQIKSKLKIKQK